MKNGNDKTRIEASIMTFLLSSLMMTGYSKSEDINSEYDKFRIVSDEIIDIPEAYLKQITEDNYIKSYDLGANSTNFVNGKILAGLILLLSGFVAIDNVNKYKKTKLKVLKLLYISKIHEDADVTHKKKIRCFEDKR